MDEHIDMMSNHIALDKIEIKRVFFSFRNEAWFYFVPSFVFAQHARTVFEFKLDRQKCQSQYRGKCGDLNPLGVFKAILQQIFEKRKKKNTR